MTIKDCLLAQREPKEFEMKEFEMAVFSIDKNALAPYLTETKPTNCLGEPLPKYGRRILYFKHPIAPELPVRIYVDVENKIIVENMCRNVYVITAIKCNTTVKEIIAAMSEMVSDWNEVRRIYVDLVYKKAGEHDKQPIDEIFISQLRKQLFGQFGETVTRKFFEEAIFDHRQLNENHYTRFMKTLTELSSLGVNDKIPFVSDKNGHVCYAMHG